MRIVNFAGILLLCVLFFSCEKDKVDPDTDPANTAKSTMTVRTSEKYQNMIGFGGALTWYSDRILSSPKSEEIFQLVFEDLGMDILRLMNWYYPLDYPENKSPESMVSLSYDSDYKTMFQANHIFYDKAKSFNQDIEVLMSSWGPPAALKSNDNLREGTLKKTTDGSFMYDAYAEYWEDILDHLGFSPDYISIQNEPGYTNSDWITCQWSGRETTTLPGYGTALEKVYEKIRDREDVPVLIGPEAENLDVFSDFAAAVKDKDYCPVYAFHPYNFNENSSMSDIGSRMSDLYNNFGDKPNLMTEFSGMSWLKTARFIQQTLTEAHTSGYIYWELVWDTPDQAMIAIDGSGNYTVTPFYYVMKHFAKYVKKGYTRIGVKPSIEYLEASGFISPDGKKLTLIIINPNKVDSSFRLDMEDGEAKSIKGFQSTENEYFKSMDEVSKDGTITIPGESVTTLDISL